MDTLDNVGSDRGDLALRKILFRQILFQLTGENLLHRYAVILLKGLIRTEAESFMHRIQQGFPFIFQRLESRRGGRIEFIELYREQVTIHLDMSPQRLFLILELKDIIPERLPDGDILIHICQFHDIPDRVFFHVHRNPFPVKIRLPPFARKRHPFKGLV
ncbi:MAG: hypothetical protein BWY49_00809 [Candidatus Omnitrophica bacterium ADurb.Bin314]|nr:MAG: hypothetical protein BWY49_00809 [Candidatus Omnitrophica bacterium ADurb.Bin314]